MESTKYLIIGGGLAAASAVEELVKADESARGATVILTSEAENPYHRPPLSKGYFLGEEERSDIQVQPDSFYVDNGIAVWHRRKARLIDPSSRTCELELNRSIKFEKALLVTGASPIRYSGPGRSLEGIHHVRHIMDSERLRRAAQDMNEVVIVGSSFLGLELASGFARKKLRTTVISRSPLVFSKLYNPEVSAFFKTYFERRGVNFILDDEVEGLYGSAQVTSVRTKKGRLIPCDGVVFAIGVEPNVDVARNSRMKVENGIAVDEQLRTSQPGIWAAGDAASFPDPIFSTRRRVEHWDNAQAQGQTAGRNLAGAGEHYDHLSMFFSDVFDLSWELWGMPRKGDQIIRRGDINDRSVFTWYVRDGFINGALMMGRSEDEAEKVQQIIKNRVRAEGKEPILKNPNRDPGDLL